ncbi:hypothetical protein ABW19_dt0210302 [Dactylella cylindrospora]|nr:hypothetical protein ABW19_dt0210302 [Dactylella cylindrospora]
MPCGAHLLPIKTTHTLSASPPPPEGCLGDVGASTCDPRDVLFLMRYGYSETAARNFLAYYGQPENILNLFGVKTEERDWKRKNSVQVYPSILPYLEILEGIQWQDI